MSSILSLLSSGFSLITSSGGGASSIIENFETAWNIAKVLDAIPFL